MNIKSVKTRQFAGIKNKEITFDSGLNVLVGNNETGKSTMIDLIYQTLYRDAKLSKNKKEDKDFFARFMPSGNNGDVVDGTLVFTTADGEYTLQKKWGASDGCELVDHNGNIIANEDTIRDIIASELIYKRGLYDDVVFGSQKSREDVVEHILNKLDKKATQKQDLVSIIAAEGMSAAGGTAPEDIEKNIQGKIDELSGHWDFSIDGPEKRRGIDNPWSQGAGAIVKAYYELEGLKDKLRKSEIAEKAIDIDNKNILAARAMLNEYRDEKEGYERYAEAIATRNSRARLKAEYIKKQQIIEDDLKRYPELLESYSIAAKLSTLSKAGNVISAYEKIKEAEDKLREAKKDIEGQTEISFEDEKKLADLDRIINTLNAKLSNLNLVANIRKLGSTDIQVKSIATGKVIDITSGEIDINETVEITVPGVMSMTLTAKGVDVENVQKQLAGMKDDRNAILSKNRVNDLEDLRAHREEYAEALRNLRMAKNEYDNLAAGSDLAKLEEDYDRLKDRKSELTGVDEKISALCGDESVDAYKARLEQNIQLIEEKYGKDKALDSMKAELEVLDADISSLDTAEKDAAVIPEEYSNISDTEVYKASLKAKVEMAEQKVKDAEGTLRDDEKALGDVIPDELRTQIEDAATELVKLKDNCRKWKHILAVLKDTRDRMEGESTMADVQNRFAEYLLVITGGRVELESMDEHMDVSIHSGSNYLTYDILSEGTKDTIALAFRLAMLEHLFPDGGGLVVLDDPFTDMDEDRTKQACMLVQKFADAGNQVIFVTCDNKYRSLLEGKVIEMG